MAPTKNLYGIFIGVLPIISPNIANKIQNNTELNTYKSKVLYFLF